MLAKGREQGVLDQSKVDLIHGVFAFSETPVRKVMVPRPKIFALDAATAPEKVGGLIVEGGFSRIPAYEGSIDNVVGIVNTKDLFHVFSLMNLVILEDAMYPALFIDPELSLGRALNVFRRERRQMAVVRGTEGPFMGIVTLEDILEEIVGEIEDEHD